MDVELQTELEHDGIPKPRRKMWQSLTPQKTPGAFETAIPLALPAPGISENYSPRKHGGRVIHLFSSSHPALLMSYGREARRKP